MSTNSKSEDVPSTEEKVVHDIGPKHLQFMELDTFKPLTKNPKSRDCKANKSRNT